MFQKGDFVWFFYDARERYPGRVLKADKDGYQLEICYNRRKSEGNDLGLVKAKAVQIQPIFTAAN
jgi:hypothetical protein